jgi:hypothetical protein
MPSRGVLGRRIPDRVNLGGGDNNHKKRGRLRKTLLPQKYWHRWRCLDHIVSGSPTTAGVSICATFEHGEHAVPPSFWKSAKTA